MRVHNTFLSNKQKNCHLGCCITRGHVSLHRGMIQCIQCPISPEFLSTWQYRDLLTTKQSPASTTVVEAEKGRILWSNAASMAMFGVHGDFNTDPLHGEHHAASRNDISVSSSAINDRTPSAAWKTPHFIDLIFSSNQVGSIHQANDC